MADTDWPITSVAVVTDLTKVPPGFIVIDKTYDKRQEADLWQDGLFGRRVYRYMCVERCAPSSGRDVLVDVVIINEKDAVPAGFTCVDYTIDTREKVVKKKTLCTRMMASSLTSDAVTELILLSKGQRKPPMGYTLVGDLNNMALCYKMSKITSPVQREEVQGSSPPINMSNIAANLPYAMPGTARSTKTGPPERAFSNLGFATVTPLSGIPFKINPKITDLSELSDITIPQIGYKTLGDLERQYEYDFSAERSVKPSRY